MTTQPNFDLVKDAILNVGSFDVIEKADPSLEESNYNLIFHREVPIELKLRESPLPNQEPVGSFEQIWIKILTRNGVEGIEDVKVELTSDRDFFFLFIHKQQNATYPLFAAR